MRFLGKVQHFLDRLWASNEKPGAAGYALVTGLLFVSVISIIFVVGGGFY